MTRVAIVLGAAVRPDGTASPALRRRAETAANLFLDGRVDQIIASGGVPQAGRSEAEVIAEICENVGVPASAIITETSSSNTLENIQNCKQLITDDAEVTLVTDRYHELRAQLIARELGLHVDCVSPEIGTTSAYRVLRGYLREAAALALYAMRRIKRISSRRSR